MCQRIVGGLMKLMFLGISTASSVVVHSLYVKHEAIDRHNIVARRSMPRNSKTQQQKTPASVDDNACTTAAGACHTAFV